MCDAIANELAKRRPHLGAELSRAEQHSSHLIWFVAERVHRCPRKLFVPKGIASRLNCRTSRVGTGAGGGRGGWLLYCDCQPRKLKARKIEHTLRPPAALQLQNCRWTLCQMASKHEFPLPPWCLGSLPLPVCVAREAGITRHFRLRL